MAVGWTMTDGCHLCKCVIAVDNLHEFLTFITESVLSNYILYLYHNGYPRNSVSLELVLVCECCCCFNICFCT